MFYHEHFFYVFSLRPRRLLEFVQDAICPEKMKLNKTTFKRVCEGDGCTYVCEHSNPVTAHRAIVNTSISTVSAIGEIFDVPSPSSTDYFQTSDFDWVDAGLVMLYTILIL